jgi:hypothetical protein
MSDSKIEDMELPTDKGKIIDVKLVKNYDVVFSSTKELLIFEDNSNSISVLKISDLPADIHLNSIVSNYCDNVITFYQKLNGDSVGILYKTSSEYKTTKSILKSSVNIDSIISTRQQNAIKIFGMDPSLKSAAVFQNSYDSTNELSSPYFFKGYDNYNDNFHIRRVIASLKNSLVFDGNVNNFVASQNLLVLSTIIDKGSS